MSKTIVSLIGVGLFSILALAERAPSIENELTQEAKSTLSKANIHQQVGVSFDGRDGTVSGEEQDRLTVEKGAEMVRAINGVRVVDVKLRPNTKRTEQGVFKLIVQSDKLQTTGRLGSAQTQQMLTKSMARVWPNRTIKQDVAVSRQSKLLPDMAEGVKVFDTFRDVEGLIVTWSDSGVRVEGNAQHPRVKDAITAAFKQHYPGHALNNQIAVAPHLPPMFRITSAQERVVLEGRVSDERTKNSLYAACKQAWPNYTIVNQLQVDPKTIGFKDVTPSKDIAFLNNINKLDYSWSPQEVVVGGWVDSAEDKAKLRASLNGNSKQLTDHTMVTPKVAEIKQAQRTINQFLRGKTIAFETGSDVPTASTVGVLKQTAQILKQSPNTLIDVRGHTDNQGKPADNQLLSQKRAAAVVKQLIKAGIEKHRLFPMGFGDTKPIASNKTANGRAKNRRVVFFVKGAN